MKNFFELIVICFIFCVGSLVPLIEPSEARFALMAKLSGGFPLVPVFYDNENNLVPYLSKPPLYIWLVKLFQQFLPLELASRLPSLLSSVGFLFTLKFLEKKFNLSDLSKPVFLFPSFFATSVLGLIDPIFSFLIFIWFVTFFLLKQHLLAGVALGLAFLCKGPVALALTVGSVAYAVYLGIIKIWKYLACLLVAVILGGGWLVFVKLQIPGSLRYYLLQENIFRFLGTADLQYGTLHREPYGLAALTSLVFFVPFLKPTLKSFAAALGLRYFTDREMSELSKLVVAQIFWVILFFSLSRSFIPSYLLPLSFFVPLLVGIEGYQISNFWTSTYKVLAFGFLILSTIFLLPKATLLVSLQMLLFAGMLFLGQRQSAALANLIFSLTTFSLIGFSRTTAEIAELKVLDCQELVSRYERHHGLELYSPIPVKRLSPSAVPSEGSCVIFEKSDFDLEATQEIVGQTQNYIVVKWRFKSH